MRCWVTQQVQPCIFSGVKPDVVPITHAHSISRHACFHSPILNPHLKKHCMKRINQEKNRVIAKSTDDEQKPKSTEEAPEQSNAIERAESALGKFFGGRLWFAVLMLCLAGFAGGYVYLIANFADFSDIPIFGVTYSNF